MVVLCERVVARRVCLKSVLLVHLLKPRGAAACQLEKCMLMMCHLTIVHAPPRPPPFL